MNAFWISLDRLHAAARRNRWLERLAIVTRLLLALGFLPSGWTKLVGNRFTNLPLDNPVGFFFEGLYRTGWYWNFLGAAQLLAALLLVIPRTATLGAVLYFPIIVNIFLITLSMHFSGTPVITGLMLLGSVFLLCWDYDRLAPILLARPASAPGRRD
jgi:uncharacterized membrane protein YphA (DoxX/SURF4 family)